MNEETKKLLKEIKILADRIVTLASDENTMLRAARISNECRSMVQGNKS